MSDEPREIELKFSLEPGHAGEVLGWLRQGRRPVHLHQTSIYFDTPDQRLRKAGLALRVRGDGQGWTQTVKSGAASGGRLGRGEWEWPVEGSSPDLDLARLSPAGAALGPTRRVAPMFTVAVDRQAVRIRTPEALIEACLDAGVVEAGSARAPVNEVELELKSGAPRALLALARDLSATFALPMSAVTKADRGFALLDGQALAPRKFQPPALTADMTAGDAFRAIARAALAQIAWNAELLRSGPSIEAIHQARVGARRLRCTLATFGKIIADDRATLVKDRLRWLARELDPARNLDVFAAGAWARLAPGAEEAAALSAARAQAYARARDAAAGAAMAALLIDTLVWVEAGPWGLRDAPGARRRERPAAQMAARRLDRALRQLLAKAGRPSRMSAADRHRLRIRAKGLRYAADVFHPLFDRHPRRARRFLGALESLLDGLGELNDIETARTIAPAFPHAAQILAAEAEREPALFAAADRAFKAFRDSRPFWDHKT